ncbi:MAG: hypothetical protein M0P73_08115 [Syntrophobacterales bacterium]|jgi:hypothetical protein|nr:hypothetical protein [Syntrophobacterales bacterium]
MRHKLRFYLGLVCFGLSLILPLFGILVAWLPQSLAAKAAIIGLLTVGGPEVLGLLAVICLGKENLLYLKDKLFAWLKRLRPPSPVSRTRYRVGLVMFLLPLIPTYIMAYLPQWLPDHAAPRLYVNLAADFIFLASLFVLGGDFWDKLRALFLYDARAEFGPRDAEPSSAPHS